MYCIVIDLAGAYGAVCSRSAAVPHTVASSVAHIVDGASGAAHSELMDLAGAYGAVCSHSAAVPHQVASSVAVA